MKISKASSLFSQILAEADLEQRNLNPALIWESFKEFAQTPFSCADDGFLFQAGCYDFTGETLFYLEFVRQFTIHDARGNYHHMEQFHVAFTRQPDQTLEKLTTSAWSYDHATLDDFFSYVESHSVFQTAVEYQGWDIETYQEKV